MAINIIDILKSQIAGQVSGQLSGRLGESEAATKSGIEAIIPTILGGLLKQVTSPGGASKLDKTLTDGGYDGGLLDNITGMLTGGDTDSKNGKGGDLVSMLLGDKASMIAPILAKLTGMKSTSITSLLAILAPLVLSFLGKQKKTMGLDANGLATLLTSQKDSITAALPAGIADTIGLGSVGMKGTPAASRTTPGTSVPAPASGGSGVLMFLIPIVILAAVGYGCYTYIFGGMRQGGAAGNVVTAAPDTPPEIRTVDPQNEEVMAEKTGDALSGLDLSETAVLPDLASLLGSMNSTLDKVKDAESAKAALPELEEIDKKMEIASSMFSGLPEAVRGKLTDSVNSMLPELQSAVDKVIQIPGVKAVLQPIVDKLMAKLQTLKA